MLKCLKDRLYNDVQREFITHTGTNKNIEKLRVRLALLKVVDLHG